MYSCPPKDPKTYGVYRCPLSAYDIWGTYGIGETYRCTVGVWRGLWMYGGVQTYWGIRMPPMLTTHICLPLMWERHPYLKLIPYTSRAQRRTREIPDPRGNEPTPDIPIAGSWQDIKKKQNGKYIMSFVRNMLIIKHVHHPSMEIEGKSLQYS